MQATQGLLYTLHLYNLNEGLPAVVGDTGKESFNRRSVERGARIVVGSGMKVLLQMPRGNLETVYPRLLAFKELRRLLLKECPDYKKAFLLVR